jgi:hypothetical protein
MDIKWIPADSSNFTVGRGSKKVNKIVMHWIVGTLESADATFANPDRDASAHYGIGDEEIHQWVKEEDTAWHASNWGVNQESIGIEHEGGWLLEDGTRKKPSDKTHETSAKLIADICNRYSLPIDRTTIHAHNEYSNTQCPGSLDIDRIINLARDQITANPIIVTDPKQKIEIGSDWGVQELQAVRSIMSDQKRDLIACQENCSGTLKEAIDKALAENDVNWQNQFESAKLNYENRIQALIKKNKDIAWPDLIAIILAKLKGGDKV